VDETQLVGQFGDVRQEIRKTILSALPAGLNVHSGRARLPFSPWKVTSLSTPGSGWPWRFTSSGL